MTKKKTEKKTSINFIEYFKIKLSKIVSTFFCVGNIKYAPGTFGSLTTFPLFFVINEFIRIYNITNIYLIFSIYTLTIILLTIVGIWAINVYLKTSKSHDPGEIVIDEVVGQLIAYSIPTMLVRFLYHNFANEIFLTENILSITKIILILTPFIFFRIFDISKFGYVGYIDSNVKGALGVMMDDVVAGIFAALSVCLVLSSFLLIINLK